MSLRHLVNELKRRNVFRAVVVYWVVAWTCIEFASVIESALDLPDWVDGSIVTAAAIGLPVVVVVSWVFEWGPDGPVTDSHFREHEISTREQELARRIAAEILQRLAYDTRAQASIDTRPG